MEITIRTKKHDEIVDITDKIQELVKREEIEEGICFLFVKHTTCGLTTADLDPGTDRDFLEFLRKIVPSISYRHPHNPSHTPDHLLSSLIGPSISIHIKDSMLELGVWQKIILVELSGPRERNIEVSLLGE